MVLSTNGPVTTTLLVVTLLNFYFFANSFTKNRIKVKNVKNMVTYGIRYSLFLS